MSRKELWLPTKPKIVACNNGAGGYTQRNVNVLTTLTEPQGIIKKWKRRMYNSPKITEKMDS